VLLVPYISEFGVRHTTENLGRLMADLHKKYPDERERSLFASVELSLRRLSPEIREKIKPLGVFQGGGHIVDIANVLEFDEKQRDSLARELLQTGLAELMPYNFLRFHPALCPYLLQQMEESELTRNTSLWAESMRQLSGFLYEQLFEDAQLALNLTTMELPNLVRLLEVVRAEDNPEATVDLATSLEQLIAQLGRKHVLAQVTAIREEEAKKIKDWSHTKYLSEDRKIDRLIDRGNLSQALEKAQILLKKCIAAGEHAYSGAAYDTAMAYFSLGRVLKKGGATDAAMQPIREAYTHFQRLADQGDTSAARMASVSLAEKGDCLFYLGRLEEAAEAYEAGIEMSEDIGDSRSAAVGKGNLGTVRMHQNRYDDALNAHHEAREIFENLGEPAMVAVAWHQMGMVHEEAGRFEAAEQAYRQSLGIEVQQNNPAGEASSLLQLSNLYDKMERLEESVIFIRQAADKYVEIESMADEGLARSNLAVMLIKLKRYDEARREIKRAIECKEPYGHAATPWKTWDILCDLEQAEGNREAAAKARDRAIELFLSYRRDGGENHEPGGRLCFDFLQALQENKSGEMKTRLAQLSNHPNVQKSTLKHLIPKLQAILKGSRDPALADDPALRYRDAAEVKLLLEKLA
jgi:tetratricopeptide (TPR) repeat protein